MSHAACLSVTSTAAPGPPPPDAVVAELIERLGHAGAPLAGGLLQRLGELCAAAEDEDEDMEEEGGTR